MRITDKYILFWETCFSNFYPCKIKYNGIVFLSSEQLFMYLKAMDFEDKDTADLIIKAGTPKEAKALGRKVKDFDEDYWEEFREENMETAVFEKFKQNPELCEELLNEKYFGRQFVEASPLDTIWGIGLHYDNLLCDNSENWKGLNLLGKVLNNVRARLLSESKSISCNKKPEICPACGEKCVVPIMFGEPSPEAGEEAAAGKVILGGCCVTGDDPKWGCLECRLEIYVEKSAETSLIDLNVDLKREYAQLKEEYSVLFEEREHKINFTSYTLTALYIEQIGKFQYEIFSLQTELKATKLKLQMIQAAKNRDEQIDIKLIDHIIQEKLKDYYKIIEEQAQDIKQAKEILDAPILSEEQTKELKAIHSFFVKRLHPDINPNYTVADQELFLKIQTAYKNLDINYLREALIAYKGGDDIPNAHEKTLQEQIYYIKTNIAELKKKIDELNTTFPFIYEENLNNQQWIEQEQEIAKKKIDELKEELLIMKLCIDKLLRNSDEYLS